MHLTKNIRLKRISTLKRDSQKKRFYTNFSNNSSNDKPNTTTHEEVNGRREAVKRKSWINLKWINENKKNRTGFKPVSWTVTQNKNSRVV